MVDIYFGCENHRAGHTFLPRDSWEKYQFLRKLDTILPPENWKGYQARFWHLTDVGLYAVAFWDYTVDLRPHSNVVFYTDQKMETVEMLPYFAKKFPEIYARFPEITELHDSFVETTIEKVRKERKKR